MRNTLGRDIIGSKDFLQFVPLLFTLFTLILVNNVFGIIPFVQYPTFSRLGFPIVLTVIVYLTYHAVGDPPEARRRQVPRFADPARPARAGSSRSCSSSSS